MVNASPTRPSLATKTIMTGVCRLDPRSRIARNAVQALDGRGLIQVRTRIERGVSIGPKRHRLALRAEIEDNGPGVPPELMDHIFYPMVTGRSDGTGLGLSIAQDIITKHGGLIECSSQPGRTVFAMYIPLENGNG